ncbi:hypothetical protein PAHAL_3G481200 [Panicum hallii]|uniref:TF-B3 domain-containing protein n=1 Tax=Panicum hallii TaxID=206008 RepID=A0A2S3HFB7_9POAL|nr:hypothetical protein PAHAL_3G481200 [Panicum hallii]
MMVEKGCESCREWREHYYREHMDVTKIRFFKFMTGDFVRGISIPAKFVKNFNGQITKGLDLKVPSGETWHVCVDKRDDELLLTSGWKDFVKAHELKENDLLIFTCRAGQHAEPYTLTDSEEASMAPQLVGSTHMASTSKKYNCKTKPRKEPQSLNSSSYHVKHEGIEEEESDDMYADSKFYYSRMANQFTVEEKENILSLASIQPENPAFVAVLQKSHCQRRSNFLVT